MSGTAGGHLPAAPAPALILMCGRSFSGKTTVAQMLGAALSAEIVSLDSINEERGLFGGQGLPIEEWIRTNEEAARRVTTILTGRGRVVVDDTSSPRFLRDNWRTLAATTASKFVLVYLNTPENVARDRLLQNRRESHRNDVLDEVMADHLDGFEPPDADEECLTTSSASEEMSWLRESVRRRIE
ncbi:AAA family ATPase [Subtercola endophyticus]|uniref:AAA family ATPase n=1 Tax=Subtercola endophyticus TaxID=2895559 RepID=UPI001E4052A6|nr:ATP-binding protein [Subtercola endophyticus]UFS59930.1 ATP-binding protein [Subtercola endophyticus]